MKNIINTLRLPILMFIVVAWCNNTFELSVAALLVIYITISIVLADDVKSSDVVLLKGAEIVIGVLLLGWLRDLPAFTIPVNDVYFNYFGETWAFAATVSSIVSWIIVKVFASGLKKNPSE